MNLNQRSALVVEECVHCQDELRIAISATANGARLIDLGIAAPGGLEAGRMLARACMAGLADVTLVPGAIAGCPLVQVHTDLPVAACLASQYAGWQISIGKFFAMGSGPMRAAAGREALFQDIGLVETASQVVGILETNQLPNDEVVTDIAQKCRVTPRDVTLLVAPTISMAGNLQVVARSVETCLHKLHELKFDVNLVLSGYGTAPLPPVASKAVPAIGRTNDAILYGGDVTLWVKAEDEQIAEIGPKVPSSASSDYGVPFAELFQKVGGDFYKIDPLLFSPARVTFHNLSSGRSLSFGELNIDLVRKSFGV